MVVHEFRIPLPLTVEEFGRGQLAMVAKVSHELTKGDEGVEWIHNEPFDNTDGHMGKCPYTGVPVPKSKGQVRLMCRRGARSTGGAEHHWRPGQAVVCTRCVHPSAVPAPTAPPRSRRRSGR